ncbi:hypothetical protein PVAP13_2KG461800 [Panicum virgatum]|uniref:Uncharacterized protein n=1 Tax=Panicum virgatum TaxID=38727 RepID=A0A8T0WI97_PANVG|nr:hypothetical protein PVAP13_2KG461800 [Panicum virgatum]KAG2645853.1 hypothetical protein PVAP13_2KG461800 [Panicum virgatum]KAG2645854.1 hypothetical protein PVAP13_2KG461800 [Panicum virgatum]KAG2645855.1 hypothetical protein PVAP13_2KG461800 [Panicum virgatum]KAG2645856.1 hypothetical protein PVAP13_2KG461800 [Panicum virgatum]
MRPSGPAHHNQAWPSAPPPRFLLRPAPAVLRRRATVSPVSAVATLLDHPPANGAEPPNGAASGRLPPLPGSAHLTGCPGQLCRGANIADAKS